MIGDALTTQSETTADFLLEVLHVHREELDTSVHRGFEELGIGHAGEARSLAGREDAATAEREGRGQADRSRRLYPGDR